MITKALTFWLWANIPAQCMPENFYQLEPEVRDSLIEAGLLIWVEACIVQKAVAAMLDELEKEEAQTPKPIGDKNE